MSYRIEWVPEDSIVLLKLSSEWHIDVMPESNQALAVVMNQTNQSFTLLMDVLDINIGFGDLVQGMSLVTKGESAPFTHPNIKQIIVVTKSGMISMAAKALGQVQYGQLRAEVFDTIEGALDYIRASNRVPG